MAKYIVIEQFIDGDDDRVTYPVNAVYPRDGYEPTQSVSLRLQARTMPKVYRLFANC